MGNCIATTTCEASGFGAAVLVSSSAKERRYDREKGRIRIRHSAQGLEV